MIISGSSFTPAPEGVHPAVCVDVVDKGMVTGAYGTKHKLRIVWEIAELMDDGRPFTVGKTYTASLHEKSVLRKDLKSWRGREFTPEELRGFDTEKVVGAPCQLVVQHEEKNGETYANVTAVLKAGASRLSPSGGYVRVKDRVEDSAPAGQSNRTNGKPVNGSADAASFDPAEYEGGDF